MWRACVSGIRIYGPSVVAFAVILVLAGVLIERRILTPHPMPDATPDGPELAALHRPATHMGLPDLRRIVLDPCTGLEKPQTRGRTAKAD